MTWSESSLALNSPPAMLCLQDVSDPGTLQSVEAAVRDNKSLKKMRIKPDIGSWKYVLTWTNVAVAVLKGAAKNETLRTLELGVRNEPYLAPHLFDAVSSPAPELVDEVRRSNPKLQLIVQAGPCESEHVTVGMTVA